MKIVYPLKTQADYTELLFSLRSVEKHITQPYEIIIVSDDLPYWVTNVTWINLGDVKGRKQLSIKRKILAALEYTESGFVMNDDIYLTKPIDIKNFPYYYFNTLKSYVESGTKPLKLQLESLGKPIKNFDIHYPILYDRRFKEVAPLFDEDCIIKSMYCNYLNIEGEQLSDCKILTNTKPEQIRSVIDSKPCFSTGVYSLARVLPILKEMFVKKSKFEL